MRLRRNPGLRHFLAALGLRHFFSSFSGSSRYVIFRVPPNFGLVKECLFCFVNSRHGHFLPVHHVVEIPCQRMDLASEWTLPVNGPEWTSPVNGPEWTSPVNGPRQWMDLASEWTWMDLVSEWTWMDIASEWPRQWMDLDSSILCVMMTVLSNIFRIYFVFVPCY